MNRYPKTRTNRRAFSTVETLVATVIALVLLLLFLPAMRRNHEATDAGKDATIAAQLRRIESAKAVYVADSGKKAGDPVTMRELLNKGYLQKDPHAATGALFDPGAVGEAPTYRLHSDE